MTPTDHETLRQGVADALSEIAPEAELAGIDPRRSLRTQLDLDSFDFLNFLIALHQRLGVEIPEADYGRVDTLDGLLSYLAARSGVAAPPRPEA